MRVSPETIRKAERGTMFLNTFKTYELALSAAKDAIRSYLPGENVIRWDSRTATWQHAQDGSRIVFVYGYFTYLSKSIRSYQVLVKVRLRARSNAGPFPVTVVGSMQNVNRKKICEHTLIRYRC